MDLYEAGKTESKKFATCCPRDVLEDLMDGVRKVEKAVLEGETQINEQLAANIKEINDNWDEFCHPAPSLVNVPRNQIDAYEGLGKWGGQG